MALHPLKEEWDADLVGANPLDFPGYEPPATESVLTGRTDHYVLVEGRFDVLGGTMGAAHGEKVVRAFRRATDERLPVVVVTNSGGARLQEGMVALVQMARTAAAATAHADAGLLQIVLHRSPTTGGVYASYGGLGDLHVAAPGTLMGFAGPRVVQQLLEVEVDESSHSAEAAFAAGRLDALLPEEEWSGFVERALGLAPAARGGSGRLAVVQPDLGGSGRSPALGLGGGWPTTASLPDPPGTAWEVVQRARHESRASGWEWAQSMCGGFVELRGADPVVRGGLGFVGDLRVGVIALDRHAGAGRPGVSGYRLARRIMRLADRLGFPLLTFVDTPGAEPGPDAERGGIAREISKTLALQSTMRVPTVSVCVGEGGSGGALAFAATDRFLILSDAVFSVIGPEGAAAILGRDAARAEEFAPLLHLTAPELADLSIVDAVVPPGDLGAALAEALATAQPDDRAKRHDAVTAKWAR